MARPAHRRRPDWSAAERDALDELVGRYGAAGRWDEIAAQLERRFGPIRPYRRLRLDLCHRRQRSRARKTASAASSTLPTTKTSGSGTTALEALLGKKAAGIRRWSSLSDAVHEGGGEGESAQRRPDVVVAAAHPADKSVDLNMSAAAAALIPGLDSAFASVHRPSPEPPGLPSASVEIAESIVRRYRSRNRTPRPQTAPTGGPRSASDLALANEPNGAFARPWSDDERRALRDLVVARGDDEDWGAVAEAMRARFGQRRRPFTSRNVQLYYRGMAQGPVPGSSTTETEAMRPPPTKRHRLQTAGDRTTTTASEESETRSEPPKRVVRRKSEERAGPAASLSPKPALESSPTRRRSPKSSPWCASESEVVEKSAAVVPYCAAAGAERPVKSDPGRLLAPDPSSGRSKSGSCCLQ